MTDENPPITPIEEVIDLGDDPSFEICLERAQRYLEEGLELPCQVTGIEDFRWEEFYVLGPGDRDEHDQLRREQPSCLDTYDLLEIMSGVHSEWALSPDDLVGRVRRKGDGKEFLLGLAELAVVDEDSRNHKVLDEYAVWFVNSR